jgi:TldD protein
MLIEELDLARYSNQFSSYTELRLHENTSMQIALLNGDVVSNTRDTSGGVSSRVFEQGAWGFSSNANMNNDSIESTIHAATNNAAFLAKRNGDPDAKLPRSKATASHDFRTKLPRKTQEEIIAFLKSCDDYIVEACPEITSRQLGLNTLDMEKKLLTSEGSSGHNVNTRALMSIKLGTKNDNDEPVELMEGFGDRGQFEDVFPDMKEVKERVDELYMHLVNKRDGVKPVSGYHDVILASDLAGILAHEAIGHTTEGDIVRAGSVAGDYIGQKVASELVTLVDFAHSYDGETLPVPVYIDDEGVECKDSVIIDKGVLTAFMHNKDSANYFDMELTGNARAFAYTDEPLVRMRNTAILPGKDKFEDMVSSIEDGYLLMRWTNGQADSTSEFMFGVQMGYEIKQGKLGRAITDTTISGVAFDMLKEITMLSDEMTWNCAGMCGKKQPMPVGMGGPAVKTKMFIGGE